MSLTEVMVAITLLVTIMSGLLGAFVQSRRMTETSVIHGAATSLVYGIIEQIKGFDYTTLVPSLDVDEEAPTTSAPPYIRVRINQDDTFWLQAVYTPYATGVTPKAPESTPAANVTAAAVGAKDNIIGPLPLSSVTGARSQTLTLNVWLWIDEMPDPADDVAQVKTITVVYTYTVNDGGGFRTVRDREVFIRTRFDQ